MRHKQLMDVWWRIRDSFADEYLSWVSIVHAARIREFLQRRRVDICQFSYALYAYDLLAQTLHHHSLPNVPNLDFTRTGTTRESLGVTGILSTSGTRFCPALLPTTLLYPESFFKQADQLGYVMPNRHLELKTWLSHRQAFDARVKEVEVEITRFLKDSFEDSENRELINIVPERYQFEHRMLEDRILNDILGCCRMVVGRLFPLPYGWG